MSNWYLSISKERFSELYGDSVDVSIFEREPENDTDLIANFLPCKLWRLNNLYTIVDKDGNRVNFIMNVSQHIVYAASLEHPRLIILKSRQQGISTFWLVSYLDDALVYQDFNVGLMAQGKSEASTLLKRVNLAWEEFPAAITDFLGLKLEKDNSEEQSWSNNSTLFIRTSFRSATLQRLHISEFGKIANKYPERARETKTGTLQAIRPGNTVVIESTAEGDNEFKRMWLRAEEAEEKAKREHLPFAGKDFKPIFLSWLNDPDCRADAYEEANQNQLQYFEKIEAETGVQLTQEQRNFWVSQYRELGDDIYQEYPATPDEAFAKTNDGSYYGVKFQKVVASKGRIVGGLYDPNLETFVTLDLGMNDTFTMCYFQEFRGEYRIVDEFYDSGEGLEYYVRHMESTGYRIETVYCPHDITVRELGTGKSRLARLRELGVTNAQVLPKLSIEAGIEQVRAMLDSLWLDSKCTYLRESLENYSKEWDEKRGVWKNKPLHDKWSHGADVIRYMAIAKARHTSAAEQVRDSRGFTSVVDGMAI